MFGSDRVIFVEWDNVIVENDSHTEVGMAVFYSSIEKIFLEKCKKKIACGVIVGIVLN